MNFLRFFPRPLLLLSGAALLHLSACDSNNDDPDVATGDGTVTWTHNGTTHTSTVGSSAIVDSGDKIIVTGGSSDNNNVVSLALQGINARGAGVYDLRRGSMLDNLPVGGLTLMSGNTGATYLTLYGPNASNGSITVSQYDRAGQKLSGTFSFTAGATPNTSAAGTQNVTTGSFSFTRFR
ncbi:DUF6252 family protein [Hymenobacter cellulosilyticus]|uniref:DUF6252 family protein n=1 Tax=Hymenobacter cellulosilyticus TaxID=2932248 RepID=A0A8T9Q654_9BACT|nr:DUF6252 family protein [Hymenobacter cellulosilyticus]UOQ71468.1 DUF6252 family protein [Hymenobacter cellulosilyticus]